MPGEEIPVSNPPPLPSRLPDHVLGLAAQVQKNPLPGDVRQSLNAFQRAAEYIAACKPSSRCSIQNNAEPNLNFTSDDLSCGQCLAQG